MGRGRKGGRERGWDRRREVGRGKGGRENGEGKAIVNVSFLIHTHNNKRHCSHPLLPRLVAKDGCCSHLSSDPPFPSRSLP